MSNLTDLIGYGLAASRPAAGVPGRLFYASDTDTLSRDNGATWDDLPSTASVAALDDIGDVDAATPSDGDVLTYDSATSTWGAAAPSGGSGGMLALINAVSVGAGGQANVSFTSIPQTGGDLILVGTAWSMTAAASDRLILKETVANYLCQSASQAMAGDICQVSAASSTANSAKSGVEVTLYDYANALAVPDGTAQVIGEIRGMGLIQGVGWINRREACAFQLSNISALQLTMNSGSNIGAGSKFALYRRAVA